MTCHHGYTPQEAIFVLLHLVVLARLVISRDAALGLRIVGSACSLAGMVYHSFVVAACESPSFATTLDAYWLAHSLFRLRVLFAFAVLLSLAFTASWCTIKCSGKLKAVKLATTNVPVLVSARLVWRICIVEDGFEDLFSEVCALTALGVAIPWLVIHTATGSRTMTWCIYLIPGLIVSAVLLRKSYNLDWNGRITPQPDC